MAAMLTTVAEAALKQDILMAHEADLTRRLRQFQYILRTEGPNWLTNRARHALSERIRPSAPIPLVSTHDVLSADLHHSPKAVALPYDGTDSAILNWVMLPPSPGSGGHTTIFRVLRHLQAKGFTNRIYFYDPYRGDHAYYAAIVRQSFGFAGPVARIEDGMADAHAVIATSWPTAYPVYNATSLGQKFYFVQDFEPAFHATSTDSILAENTYRMGLRAITAGSWLSQMLRRDYGMAADHFDFGCDASAYNIKPSSGRRRGIAFYARPGAARRGFELGMMTLELIAKRRPEFEIHLYGGKLGELAFKFINHGIVPPHRLNDIYNLCGAGLTLSLTNVSLVPHEMLAAGCIPVVNDAEHNRMVLDNPFVRYAAPSPHMLALAIEAVMDDPDPQGLAQAAAASVKTRSWDDAGEQVAAILRSSLWVTGSP